jgi:hypothetical protein
MPDKTVDIDRVVGEVAGVLAEPYQEFLATLYAEGRISDDELQQVNREVRERGARLGKLVQARLREQDEPED